MQKKDRQSFSTLIESHDIDASIDIFFKRLGICLDALLSNRLGLNYNNDYTKACLFDIATIISEIKIDDKVQLTIRNILLNAVLNSEKKAIGSGLVTALAFLEAHTNKNYDYDYNTLVQNTKQTNLKIANSIIRNALPFDNKIYHMLLEACGIAGHNGRIYVNTAPKDRTYIELTSGYKFDIKIDKAFFHAASIAKWNRSNVKVFIIDGIIESISEVNHIFEALAESKEPGVIFARGYHNDILSTCAINLKRGSLDVVPVAVPFDLKGMNMLKDIAVVCNSDVVSSLKGELISSINVDDIPTIDMVLCDDTSVILECSSSRRATSLHLRSLRKKIETEKNVDKINLLNDRVKSISSNCVEISFGSEYKDNLKLAIHKFESGIRMMSEISRFGILELDNCIHDLGKDSIPYNIFKKLINTSFLHIPAPMGIDGLLSGLEAYNSVSSIGAFIIIDP